MRCPFCGDEHEATETVAFPGMKVMVCPEMRDGEGVMWSGPLPRLPEPAVDWSETTAREPS